MVLQGATYAFTVVGNNASGFSEGVGPGSHRDHVERPGGRPSRVCDADTGRVHGEWAVRIFQQERDAPGERHHDRLCDVQHARTADAFRGGRGQHQCPLRFDHGSRSVRSSLHYGRSPQNQKAAAGATASFWVAASGAIEQIDFGYPRSINGQPIAGATKSILNLPSVSPASAGSYTVTATNVLGSVTSQPASLSLTAAGGVPPSSPSRPRRPRWERWARPCSRCPLGGRVPAPRPLKGRPPSRPASPGTPATSGSSTDPAITGATSPTIGLGALTPGYDGD